MSGVNIAAMLVRNAEGSPEFKLMRIAASLLSEDAENAEYDRACVEICCEFFGLATDDNRDAMLRALREVKAVL